MGKIISLTDVTFDEQELINWLENSDWDQFGIKQQLSITDMLSNLVGGEVFFCDVCDLKDDKQCSAILLGIKKDNSLCKGYFLILIEAWDSEKSLIGVGSSFLCNV